MRIADIDDTNAVDNGNTFAVTSIPGVDFKLTTDQPDRTWYVISEATHTADLVTAIPPKRPASASV